MHLIELGKLNGNNRFYYKIHFCQSYEDLCGVVGAYIASCGARGASGGTNSRIVDIEVEKKYVENKKENYVRSKILYI